MNAQKSYKMFQARQAFARNVDYIRAELKTSTRTDHLQPAIELLEWLARDMAELAGVTGEVQACAREYNTIRTQVAEHALRCYAASKPAKPQPRAKFKLRLVK